MYPISARAGRRDRFRCSPHSIVLRLLGASWAPVLSSTIRISQGLTSRAANLVCRFVMVRGSLPLHVPVAPPAFEIRTSCGTNISLTGLGPLEYNGDHTWKNIVTTPVIRGFRADLAQDVVASGRAMPSRPGRTTSPYGTSAKSPRLLLSTRSEKSIVAGRLGSDQQMGEFGEQQTGK